MPVSTSRWIERGKTTFNIVEVLSGFFACKAVERWCLDISAWMQWSSQQQASLFCCGRTLLRCELCAWRNAAGQASYANTTIVDESDNRLTLWDFG